MGRIVEGALRGERRRMRSMARMNMKTGAGRACSATISDMKHAEI